MVKISKEAKKAKQGSKSAGTGATRGRKKGPKKIYKCPREDCGAVFKRNDRL